MPAISKVWVPIADGAVDPDSPLDTTLMTGLRDDLVHLREWMGASYFAGAVQDHNHDGVNSAPTAGGVGTVKVWPGLVLPGVNWDWCDGGTLSRATNALLKDILMKEAQVTMTIATPCVVTWPAHGLRTNHPIRFFNAGGALPTGITAGTHGGAGVGTEYYVKVIDGNTFNIAATPGGANINTTGVQSGVHTGTVAPHGDGDGVTTFHKPDMKGRVPFGRDDMGGTAANRVTVGNSGIEARVAGRNGGTETHTLTSAQVPATSVRGSAGDATVYNNSGGSTGFASGTGTPEATATVNGSGALHQNMPPSIVEDWIIQIL